MTEPSAPAASSAALLPGELVDPFLGRLLGGRYRVQSVLGHGGMADVYRALDETLRRPVAVKLFRPGVDAHADRARFDTEVHTLAALSHPGLVALYDFGQDVSRPWCVMQFVDGGTLGELAAAAPVDPQHVARVGAEVAEVLGYVHGLGIVHRDVKPSNVLLDTDGSAYLSDFGVAQIVDATRVTASGALLGTAAYLSPEQVLGKPATSAVDVYALALVLLETITGHREYPGSPVESAVARLARAPRVPGWLGETWSQLLGSMTALDAAERPPAVDVARRLRVLARVPLQRPGTASGPATEAAPASAPGSEPGSARGSEPSRPATGSPAALSLAGTRVALLGTLARRHRAVALAGAAALLVTSAAGLAVLSSWRGGGSAAIARVTQTTPASAGSGAVPAARPTTDAAGPVGPTVARTSSTGGPSLPGATSGSLNGRKAPLAGGPGPAVTVTVTAASSAPSRSASPSGSPSRSGSPAPSRSSTPSSSPSVSVSPSPRPSPSASVSASAAGTGGGASSPSSLSTS